MTKISMFVMDGKWLGCTISKTCGGGNWSLDQVGPARLIKYQKEELVAIGSFCLSCQRTYMSMKKGCVCQDQ
jgi:hypothetical protein